MIIDITKQPDFFRIEENINRREAIQAVIAEAARPFFIASLFNKINTPLIVITSSPKRATQLKDEIDFWLEREACVVLPENEFLQYQRLPENRLNARERVESLVQLAAYTSDSAPPVIILTARNLAFRTVEYDRFINNRVSIKQGQMIDPLEIVLHLQRIGYTMESTVTMPGDFSRRGGILDVFPVGAERPVRIDFFGDEVEEIREFDAVTQRSIAVIEEVSAPPVTEMSAALFMPREDIKNQFDKLESGNLGEEVYAEIRQDIDQLVNREYLPHASYYGPLFFTESILDYCPSNSVLIFDDADYVQWTISNINTEDSKARQAYVSSGLLPGGMPSSYFNWQQIEERVAQNPTLWMYSWEPETDIELFRFDFKPLDKFGGSYERFSADVGRLLKDGKEILVVSHQAERINDILQEEKIPTSIITGESSELLTGHVALRKGILDGGWNLDNKFFLYTDAEILGFTRQNRQPSKARSKRTITVDHIKPGDYVVHIDHGIARFAGITKMGDRELPHEFLILEYAEQDRLYVPVDQINRVSRYHGSSGAAPSLNRLGTSQWHNTREKAAEAVKEIATELLALYSKREIIEGFSYSEDSIWQREMEASFPYMETPDQLTALASIKKDMSRARPMDRLLLGDVGYGKTEVAIRAAFKAIQDNRQVAVLVPTTLLAQQHYITFMQRLGAYPVIIESLSRFKTQNEQKEIISRLGNGSVDIIIGTHRLLQKDVKFKNLGLIIIDEEQRFGVKHKEYLKKKRAEVDVLAMSATPIPRTLYMALTGVRDMSTIETPPEERLPVHTTVAKFNPQLIREAIMREVERNGQVFFVHNRVRSISEMSHKLKDIVPEARFAIAHGQMEENELAQVMTDFTSGKIDVLVCTTIIESGLDVPNANTLIVNRADKFGLIQLHQLRGRVGRGATSAYAYFVYDEDAKLTEDGRRRLQTIYELAELGSGFNIAMKDLEIRGSGTLLGTHQSGHIAAVGLNMYTELLKAAIAEEKASLSGQVVKPEKNLPEPEINIPLVMLIPEYYVTDDDERLLLYRRLAGFDNHEDLEDFRAELIDRFGGIPEETANLIYGVRIKLLARKAGIGTISSEDDKIILLPYQGLRFDPAGYSDWRKDGVIIHPYRIALEIKKPGFAWRTELESILMKGISIFGNCHINGA